MTKVIHIVLPPLVEKKENTWLVYNLVPNKEYFYLLIDDTNGSLVDSGQFYTNGQIRMINAGVISNVRDIGGWNSSLGGSMKYGRLYRGGQLEDATENDLMTLREIGVDSELDLRGYAPSGLVPDDSYSCFSLDKFYDIRNFEKNCGAIRILISELRKGKNVYVHCMGVQIEQGSYVH